MSLFDGMLVVPEADLFTDIKTAGVCVSLCLLSTV